VTTVIDARLPSAANFSLEDLRLEEENQKPGKLFGGGFARRPGLSAMKK
jgi:hypothetical protein